MSPEQAKTGPAGPASDIFSLGCVLAYAATGSPPFGGENPASVLFRIVSAEPDMSAIPPRLRQVIEACLKKDPAQRPEPAQVIAMINALGPKTQATLGSFWPENVARVIAAEQAGQTPAGLTPPAAPSYAGSAGNGAAAAGAASAAAAGSAVPSGAAGAASPPAAERTPTALATPAPGQGGSPTGHAPMLSDGYYAAAAQGRSTPAPAAPPHSSPAGSYAMPQAPPAGQGTYVQAVFGQPGLATPAAYPSGPPTSYPAYSGQAGSYPGQAGSYPGQQDPLARYAPGRRKPTAAEVPGNVLTAIRLMYIGFVVTVLDLVLSLLVLGRYTHDANLAKNAADRDGDARVAAAKTAIWHTQNQMAGAMAIGVVAAVLGLVCWACLAVATRRGNGWTRVAGTVLLAIYSICALLVVFGTHRDPGPQFTTVLVWAIGVAAVIPLWSQQARDFFYAWRKR
jgi:hypothetical protein